MFRCLNSRLVRAFSLALLACAALVGPAFADGIIIIDPPPCLGPQPCPTPIPIRQQLEIKYHRVSVTIDNQVATTRVDQLFYNPNAWPAEGTYIFPLPADAAVSEFAMWVDGKKIEASLLSADEARQTYEDIVRRQRDPALLEYVGQGAVQARLFPIPPGGERQIEIEYSQVLRADNGLIHYLYPLNTEKFSARPLEEVTLSVDVTSREAIRAMYSPSHKIAVDRRSDFRYRASYEASNLTPDTDFSLYYSVSPDDIGLNLLTYRDPAEGDGFFLLLAAPGLAADESQVVAKDVLIVLDQSGSMEGEKFAQAQAALKYILDHLNSEDRFNLIAFSTGTRQSARDLQPASRSREAARWVDRLEAQGGTNINLALLEALHMVDRERPSFVIFLTDGLATEGVTDTQAILANVSRAAPSNLRLFAFGVGDDVDTILLDTLVEQNHGASSYVRPGERIDEAVSGFYAKVSTPVLADIQIDYGKILVEDTYPTPLPDLFAGSQVVLVGRYREGGRTTVVLSGTVNGRRQSFEYADQTFRASSGPGAAEAFIPRLWATRKIGYLLNQIRLYGKNKEWVDAIVELSVRYGIVTPYTSYLITEEDVLTSAGRQQLAQEQFMKLQAMPTQLASGAAAVQNSQQQAALSAADSAEAPHAEAANVVKIVGDRTFLLADGVWTDTAFDPSQMKTTPVQFASDDYFQLIGARPDLAAAFALGSHVIAFSEGVAYEVVDASAAPLAIPPTYTPASVSPAGASVASPPAMATQPATSVMIGPVVSLGWILAGIVGGLGVIGLAGWLAYRRRNE